MKRSTGIASIIMAAGRGSRMKGYGGNKTLLPLNANGSILEGTNPILLHILDNLPSGPKAIIVNHDRHSVMEMTAAFDPTYCFQPELNGTGGALLASRTFIENLDCDRLIITMGDVPMVKTDTYVELIGKLKDHAMVVLGFHPENRKQYGVLDCTNGNVNKIIEHKYWKHFPAEKQSELRICNSGIYAVRTREISAYLSVLAQKPHVVRKRIDDRPVEFKEYFITDLIELMANDGVPVGYEVAKHEHEVMGVDDIDALKKVQKLWIVEHG